MGMAGVREMIKTNIQNFSWKTWRKETTWET